MEPAASADPEKIFTTLMFDLIGRGRKSID